jgi:hypothetical protein
MMNGVRVRHGCMGFMVFSFELGFLRLASIGLIADQLQPGW